MIAVLPVALVLGILAGFFTSPGLDIGGGIGIVYAVLLPTIWPRYVYHRYPQVTLQLAAQLLRGHGYTVVEPGDSPESS